MNKDIVDKLQKSYNMQYKALKLHEEAMIALGITPKVKTYKTIYSKQLTLPPYTFIDMDSKSSDESITKIANLIQSTYKYKFPHLQSPYQG